MEIETNSADETKQLAADFFDNQITSNVICLYGDLGSGKTTFVQGLADHLEIQTNITSPTFLILKTYTINKSNPQNFTKLIHIDLYRVHDWNDIESLGLEELWSNPSNLVIIEWPERITKHLPQNNQRLEFKHKDQESRIIRINQ